MTRSSLEYKKVSVRVRDKFKGHPSSFLVTLANMAKFRVSAKWPLDPFILVRTPQLPLPPLQPAIPIIYSYGGTCDLLPCENV